MATADTIAVRVTIHPRDLNYLLGALQAIQARIGAIEPQAAAPIAPPKHPLPRPRMTAGVVLK